MCKYIHAHVFPPPPPFCFPHHCYIHIESVLAMYTVSTDEENLALELKHLVSSMTTTPVHWAWLVKSQNTNQLNNVLCSQCEYTMYTSLTKDPSITAPIAIIIYCTWSRQRHPHSCMYTVSGCILCEVEMPPDDREVLLYTYIIPWYATMTWSKYPPSIAMLWHCRHSAATSEVLLYMWFRHRKTFRRYSIAADFVKHMHILLPVANVHTVLIRQAQVRPNVIILYNNSAIYAN